MTDALTVFRFALGTAAVLLASYTVYRVYANRRARAKASAEHALKLENDKLRTEIGRLKAHIRMIETVVADQNIPRLETFAKPGAYKWSLEEQMRAAALQNAAMQQNNAYMGSLGQSQKDSWPTALAETLGRLAGPF